MSAFSTLTTRASFRTTTFSARHTNQMKLDHVHNLSSKSVFSRSLKSNKSNIYNKFVSMVGIVTSFSCALPLNAPNAHFQFIDFFSTYILIVLSLELSTQLIKSLPCCGRSPLCFLANMATYKISNIKRAIS